MNLKHFFNNLEVFFEDEELKEMPAPCMVYKDENNKVKEIRIFNTEYDEILVIERDGSVKYINVDEFVEQNLTK